MASSRHGWSVPKWDHDVIHRFFSRARRCDCRDAVAGRTVSIATVFHLGNYVVFRLQL